MTIEQFAAEQGQSHITRYTLPSGAHVYELYNDDGDEVVGLPIYALETADGWRLATAKETYKIMFALN